MPAILHTFEAHVDLQPRQACRLLGIAYVTYAHYRSGMRVLPPYHVRHITTISMLTAKQLAALKKEVSP